MLGICYWHQLIAYLNGAKVERAEKEEQELTKVNLFESQLFEGIDKENFVEMRHKDRVFDLPEGFKLTAYTADCPIAGMENIEKNIFAIQFHP